MSTQADYTPDEWNVLVMAPAQASMLVINADKTGGISGQFGIIQEMKDARTNIQSHADTDVSLVREAAHALLEQPSWKAALDKATPETVTTSLSRADQIVAAKAAPDEAVAYKQYVMDVARKTASATKESSGVQTSDREKVALTQIASLLHLNG